MEINSHPDYATPYMAYIMKVLILVKNKYASPLRLAQVLVVIGAACRNRTGDLFITNELLYRLS